MDIGAFYEKGFCHIDSQECRKNPFICGLPNCANCPKILERTFKNCTKRLGCPTLPENAKDSICRVCQYFEKKELPK